LQYLEILGMAKIEVGTCVAFARDYLQYIGSYEPAMADLRGKVIAFEDVAGWPMAVAHWDTGHEQRVAICNLVRADELDEFGVGAAPYGRPLSAGDLALDLPAEDDREPADRVCAGNLSDPDVEAVTVLTRHHTQQRRDE
jgi:hypothetical protein